MPGTSLAMQSGRGKKKSKQQVDEEARQCYEMRLAGLRTDQIAKNLGIAVGTVVNRAKRGGEMAVVPAVEEYRAMVAGRLDTLLHSLLRDNPKATPRVVEAAVQIETARAKLYGLNAPVQVEQTITMIGDGGIDDEVRRLAAELGLVEASSGNSEEAASQASSEEGSARVDA